MTDGLITRIGKWIDNKWESKATESQLDNVRQLIQDRWNNLENAQIKDKVEVMERIDQMKVENKAAFMGLRTAIASQAEFVSALQKEKVPPEIAKDLADLKTRVEKIELYSGMKRTVDPTKPPVLKSAFQI